MNKPIEAKARATTVTPLELNENLAKEISRAVCTSMRETFGIEVVPGAFETGEGPHEE